MTGVTKEYVGVFNRNTTQEAGHLDPDLLLFMGASTDRGLTGQGMGFKFIVADALKRGMEVARASQDEHGSYIAHFYGKDKAIAGKVEQQICMLIQRPGKSNEYRETTQLVRIADHSWSDNPLGKDYPLLREPVLDAADEDADFKVKIVGEIDYAEVGHTATFLTATKELRDVVDLFWYYFKRTKDVQWISERVGITACGSVNEHRYFLTVKGASIAYVAFTSGDDEGAGLDPAYDYILAETEDSKLASPPKRLVEDPGKVGGLIRDAWHHCDDPKLLARVLASIRAKGLESRWHWYSDSWYWGGWETLRAGFAEAFGPWPIIDVNDSLAMLEASAMGKKYSVVGETLFALGKAAGITTLFQVLGVRDKDEEKLRAITAKERAIVVAAVNRLQGKFGGDFRAGHMFMGLEADKTLGYHIPNHAGSDVIALNFVKLAEQGNLEYEVTKTLLHEMAHHQAKTNSKKYDNHHIPFANALIALTLGIR